MKDHSVKIYIKESNMNFYPWALIADGFFFDPSVAEFVGVPLKGAVLIAENDNGSWGVEEKHWNELGKTLNLRLERGEFPLEKLLTAHQEIGERVFKHCGDILEKDLKKLKNSDFIKWLSIFWTDMLKLNGLGLTPVVSDFEHNILTKNLMYLLGRHEKYAKRIQNHLSVLISSDRPDLNWKELLEFLALVKKYESIDKLKSSESLKQHIKKYNWINFGYIGPVWKKKDFLERARKILSNGPSISQQFSRHRRHFEKIRRKQRELEKLLGLTKHEKIPV